MLQEIQKIPKNYFDLFCLIKDLNPQKRIISSKNSKVKSFGNSNKKGTQIQFNPWVTYTKIDVKNDVGLKASVIVPLKTNPNYVEKLSE